MDPSTSTIAYLAGGIEEKVLLEGPPFPAVQMPPVGRPASVRGKGAA